MTPQDTEDVKNEFLRRLKQLADWISNCNWSWEQKTLAVELLKPMMENVRNTK